MAAPSQPREPDQGAAPWRGFVFTTAIAAIAYLAGVWKAPGPRPNEAPIHTAELEPISPPRPAHPKPLSKNLASAGPKAPNGAPWKVLNSAADGPCVPIIGTDRFDLAPGCRVLFQTVGITVEVWRPTKLALEDGRLRLISGHLLARLEATRIGSDPATLMHARGGLRSQNARLAIYQDHTGGWLDLLEGELSLEVPDKEPSAINAGSRHTW